MSFLQNAAPDLQSRQRLADQAPCVLFRAGGRSTGETPSLGATPWTQTLRCCVPLAGGVRGLWSGPAPGSSLVSTEVCKTGPERESVPATTVQALQPGPPASARTLEGLTLLRHPEAAQDRPRDAAAMPRPSSTLPTCTEAAGEVLPRRRPRSFRATEPSSRPERPLWLSAWRPGPRHTEHHRPSQGAADSGSVEQKAPTMPWERPHKSRQFSSKARGLVFLGLPTSRGDTRTTFGSLKRVTTSHRSAASSARRGPPEGWAEPSTKRPRSPWLRAGSAPTVLHALTCHCRGTPSWSLCPQL